MPISRIFRAPIILAKSIRSLPAGGDTSIAGSPAFSLAVKRRVERRIGIDEEVGDEAVDLGPVVLRHESLHSSPQSPVVMAGLDPAIHSVTTVTCQTRHGMDARIKSGHDDIWKTVAPLLRRQASVYPFSTARPAYLAAGPSSSSMRMS